MDVFYMVLYCVILHLRNSKLVWSNNGNLFDTWRARPVERKPNRNKTTEDDVLLASMDRFSCVLCFTCPNGSHDLWISSRQLKEKIMLFWRRKMHRKPWPSSMRRNWMIRMAIRQRNQVVSAAERVHGVGRLVEAEISLGPDFDFGAPALVDW